MSMRDLRVVGDLIEIVDGRDKTLRLQSLVVDQIDYEHDGMGLIIHLHLRAYDCVAIVDTLRSVREIETEELVLRGEQ